MSQDNIIVLPSSFLSSPIYPPHTWSPPISENYKTPPPKKMCQQNMQHPKVHATHNLRIRQQKIRQEEKDVNMQIKQRPAAPIPTSKQESSSQKRASRGRAEGQKECFVQAMLGRGPKRTNAVNIQRAPYMLQNKVKSKSLTPPVTDSDRTSCRMRKHGIDAVSGVECELSTGRIRGFRSGGHRMPIR